MLIIGDGVVLGDRVGRMVGGVMTGATKLRCWGEEAKAVSSRAAETAVAVSVQAMETGASVVGAIAIDLSSRGFGSNVVRVGNGDDKVAGSMVCDGSGRAPNGVSVIE